MVSHNLDSFRDDADPENKPGTYLAIASFTCYLLLRRGKDYPGRRLMLTYTALMAVLTTIWVFANATTSARALSGAHDPNVASAPATVISKLASTLQVLVSDGALVRVTALARRTADLLHPSSTARGFSGAATCVSWDRCCSFMSSKSVRASHDKCIRWC
jgi:hypothetical protein